MSIRYKLVCTHFLFIGAQSGANVRFKKNKCPIMSVLQ